MAMIRGFIGASRAGEAGAAGGPVGLVRSASRPSRPGFQPHLAHLPGFGSVPCGDAWPASDGASRDRLPPFSASPSSVVHLREDCPSSFAPRTCRGRCARSPTPASGVRRSVGSRSTCRCRPNGTMPGRLYAPAGRPRRMVLLVPGFHPAGIDEPRLIALARELAASGIAVVTPDVPELSRFEIAPAITDRIEAAAVWLSKQSSRPDAAAGDGRIGLMGISFSGGFRSWPPAALRSETASRTCCLSEDTMTSRGFSDTCAWGRKRDHRGNSASRTRPSRCMAETEQIFARRPDDYGVAVFLLGVADRVVPRPQVDALRAAVRRSLEASALERDDQPRDRAGDRGAAKARRQAAGAGGDPAPLRERSRRRPPRRAPVAARARLRRRPGAVAREVAEAGGAAFSPPRHGRQRDPVLEAEYLADQLRGQTPVRLLMTNVISHAGIDHTPRAGEVLRLAGFWGDLLSR